MEIGLAMTVVVRRNQKPELLLTTAHIVVRNQRQLIEFLIAAI